MLSDEEKKAIEWLKKADWFSARLYSPTILNLIEKQQKEIEELNKSDESKEQSSMKYYNLYKELVDKIKAKIEELEIEQESNREDLKIAIDNLIFQNIDKIGNKISINMSVRGVLQSLLEKE